MDALKRRGHRHCNGVCDAEQAGAFDNQKRPQAFATTQAAMAHRRDEALWCLAIRCKTPVQLLFRGRGHGRQPRLEILAIAGGSRRHRSILMLEGLEACRVERRRHCFMPVMRGDDNMSAHLRSVRPRELDRGGR